MPDNRTRMVRTWTVRHDDSGTPIVAIQEYDRNDAIPISRGSAATSARHSQMKMSDPAYGTTPGFFGTGTVPV